MPEIIERHEIAFGRAPSPLDVRDRDFPMALALEDVPLPPWRYWRLPLVRLNQNGYPHCVAYATEHWSAAAPVMTSPTNATADALYARCKQLDGLPPNTDGTYVRIALKVMQEQNRVARYLWATSLDELKRWVLLNGSVVAGTAWHDGMSNPDAKGVMHPTGALAGGHAYLVVGYSSIRRMFRCLNSWGEWWSQGGQAWIGEDDLWRLIRDSGEAVGIEELKVLG